MYVCKDECEFKSLQRNGKLIDSVARRPFYIRTEMNTKQTYFGLISNHFTTKFHADFQ